MAEFSSLSEALIKGQAPVLKDLVTAALAEGTPPTDILELGLIAGMTVIGERFKNNEIYVPEVLIAARAMKAAMEVLRPALTDTGVEPKGTVALGTVKGDLHDIGKNLVGMMLEGAGYRVIDLGFDVPPEKFVEAAKDGAKIIGMSALLTTTMPSMKRTIEALEAEGLRDGVKVMIGGAPVTDAYASEIGADGYSPDATAATALVTAFMAG